MEGKIVPPANEPQSAQSLIRVFRVLADETRFRLLRLLAREELTVNELATITQLAQPRISNHLKILREENLIVERREGSWRHYRIDPQVLPEAAQILWPSVESAWRADPQFAADDKRLASTLAARSRPHGTFFDELAGHWDEIRDQLFGDALGREILRALLPPDLVVADIGTGTGYMADLFGRRAARLIAIDNSEAMLSVARDKASAAGITNIEFRLADAEENPLAPAEADVVTIVQVLHHLENPDRAIAAAARGLRPHGRLIVSDFLEHREGWLKEELNHRWPGFSRGRVEGWLQAAGLEALLFDVIPGRNYESPDGRRLLVPDGFVCVAGLL